MKTYKIEIEVQVSDNFELAYPNLIKNETALFQYALIHARTPRLEGGTLFYEDGEGMGLRIVVSKP